LARAGHSGAIRSIDKKGECIVELGIRILVVLFGDEDVLDLDARELRDKVELKDSRIQSGKPSERGEGRVTGCSIPLPGFPQIAFAGVVCTLPVPSTMPDGKPTIPAPPLNFPAALGPPV
jgi:hypothetical protein